jgi:hypothetical protein
MFQTLKQKAFEEHCNLYRSHIMRLKICTPHPILCGDKIENNEMDGAYRADGREERGV